MNIVLLEPEIPHNTGAIGRTCVATNSKLHLIKPLGFDISEKQIRRTGLDYWEQLDFQIYENFNEFLEKNNNPQIFMATTKALKTYCDVEYDENSFVMFGKESKGIPEEILKNYKQTCIRIPMIENMRSINLANCASIIIYEALRQNDFKNLELTGQLHNSTW